MEMQAILLREYGGIETLKLETTTAPEPGPGEILIRNHAIGVNHCDTDVRRGLFGVGQTFPHVMGVDSAGVVEAVGPGVIGFKVGDRVSPHFLLTCGTCRNCIRGKENICLNGGVLGVTSWGTYAQFTKIPAHNVIHLPDGLGFAEAVAAQTAFATAWEALIEEGRLQVGETVMINAAGSGVGSAGIQIAKLAGARVIATTGSDAKFAAARDLGADEVLNYSTTDIPKAVHDLTDGIGVDVVLDMVGGERLIDSIGALAQGGRLVTVGAHAGEKVEIDMIEFFRKHISMHGCGRSTKAIVQTVLGLVAEGKLKPVIHRQFPLAEAGEAHRVMESRNFFGRMILDPWAS
ncbi:quinone oxidoreductase family protein [Tabrizicola sp. BL-A-41-H6]|uniref:quinone oxidoreductase family protein n=1 Tax=Tabrizicola sp. BL-A-41-H6 TaxID=3421107 RepID=UPI003D67627A